MSVRSIEAEVSIKSGVQAECSIGREVIVEVHDDVNLESLTATANGSYRPESGVDGYDRVDVAVPERQPITEPLSVTANGQYEPSEGVDGFSDVTVSVPERIPVTESLTVTENGLYEPTEGVDGYDSVSVAVPDRLPVTESLTVTANGTYEPDSGVDGYDHVTVAVPERRPTFTLIGQSTHVLQEYESTTAEVIDTGIDIKNTDYVFLLVIITCDGVKTNAQDWGGLSIYTATRYTNTKNVYVIGSVGFRNNTLSLDSMTDGLITTTYGVYGITNVATVRFQRKAHATACPKIMAGTYNVKVYGIDSL